MKVLLDGNIEKNIDDNDFALRRGYRNMDDHHNVQTLFNDEAQNSVHNQTLTQFLFRCDLIEKIQKELHSSRGGTKSNKGQVSIQNVSPILAKTLYSHIQDQFSSTKIMMNCGKSEKEKVTKDIMFHTKNNDCPNLHIIKMDQRFDANQTIVAKVPFPDFLFGYFSVHFHKFPIGVDMSRKLTPSLNHTKFDYIPNLSEIIFEYNCLSNILNCSFEIRQSLNKDIILNQKSFREQLAIYVDTLTGKAFYDELFKWTVSVVMVNLHYIYFFNSIFYNI
jgi:hypothetical protein